MPVPRLLLATLSSVLAAASFAADVAYSPPVGGMTVTLSAAVSGVPKLSTFTPSMRLPISASFVGKSVGTFSAVTATTLEDSTAGWATNGLATSGAPYFVRVKSGAGNGTWWQVSTNTATAATVAANRGFTPTAAGIAPGDAYEIVPGDTLQTLFSGIASSIGGTSASVADAVRIHDGVAWREYYYNTSQSMWREGNIPGSRNAVVVRPDSGIVFIRKTASDVSFVMLGNVSTGVEKIAVGATGVTVIGSVFPVVRTLGSIAVHTNAGFVPNSGTLAAADKLGVFDGVAWKSFSYSQSNSRWQELIFDRTNYALPLGAPLVLERGVGASSAYWVTLTPPYSL